MNRAPQVADAFAVNDAHPENAALLALRKVIANKVIDLTRIERVQIQHAVDRQVYRVVHVLKIQGLQWKRKD